MSNTNTSRVSQKMYLTIAITSCLMGFAFTMCQNYASYSYTDLAGIDTATMGICMFIVNVIATCMTFVSGAIVAKTRSRMGKFRPWIIFGNAVCMLGGFLVFFNMGSSIILKAVIISIGFLLANSTMDFTYVAKSGLITNIGGPDSDARNKLMGNNMLGAYAALCIAGFAVVPLVGILGKGNESKGFILTQLLFTILVMTGSIWLFSASRQYDPSNTDSVEASHGTVKFTEMIKAVVTNRLALIVTLCDILRNTGYGVLASLMIYQCTYVIGDMKALAYVLSISSFCGAIGALIAPRVVHKFGGRKRTIAVFGILTGLGFASIGLFGKSMWGFVFSCSIAFLCQSFLASLLPLLYIDAGEYWLYKTGNDTRPYLISMYNVAVKVAMALASLVLSGVLTAIHYQPGTALDTAGANMLTWIVALIPALGFLIPVVLMKFHNVSDEEMNEIIHKNAAKQMQVQNNM